MKTLQICDNLDPNTSEGQRVITIANKLAKQGNQVTIATVETAHTPKKQIESTIDSQVTILWHKPLFKFSNYHYSPRLSVLLSRDNYDIIHAHSYRHYGTYIGAKIAQKTGSPYILSPYGSISHESVTWFKPLYTLQDTLTGHLPLKAASRILANTEYEKEEIIQHGVPPEKIDIIYREVDTDLFQNKAQSIDPSKIVFVGRVTPIKRIELIIESLTKLPKNIHLEIIGPIENETYYQRLQDQVKTQNMETRVKFHGKQSTQQIASSIASSLVLVLPSKFENLGGVILEAQACECPVIASSVGGLPEIIRENETGFLLKEATPTELAEKISQIANNPEQRTMMGRKAREYIKENYSTEAYIENQHGDA